MNFRRTTLIALAATTFLWGWTTPTLSRPVDDCCMLPQPQRPWPDDAPIERLTPEIIRMALVSITVTPDDLVFNSIKPIQLKVLGHLNIPHEGPLPDLTAGETGTTYISGDTNIVQVSPDGLVTRVGPGITRIFVKNGRCIAQGRTYC